MIELMPTKKLKCDEYFKQTEFHSDKKVKPTEYKKKQ